MDPILDQIEWNRISNHNELGPIQIQACMT